MPEPWEAARSPAPPAPPAAAVAAASAPTLANASAAAEEEDRCAAACVQGTLQLGQGTTRYCCGAGDDAGACEG